MARTNTTGSSGPGSGTVTSVTGLKSVLATPNPIIGAGTLELVNDSALPGGNQYYGTNVGGTKGFFPLPSGLALISDTYININTLVTGNLLEPGQFYEINDYQTICILPGPLAGGTVFGAQEPLILQAATTNTFVKQAWSTVYPEDYIEYDFIDSTSANPGILIPNGNMGRISHRRDTTPGQVRSAPYDFRVCQFYHPDSVYDFTGVSFPITLVNVDIDGAPTGLSGTFNDLDEVIAYLNNPSNLFFCIASHVLATDILTVFSLYSNLSFTAGKWTDMDILDSGANPLTITPVVTEDNYFTFGNTIQTFGGTYTPAANGNVIARNVHIAPCSDAWSGTVMNNIIFGSTVVDWTVGAEVINGVVGDGCWDGKIGSDCYYGFWVAESSAGINIGMRNGYINSLLAIQYGANSVTIGDYNEYEIYLPRNASNWEIGEGMSLSGALDLTSVVTLRDRILKTGYSNLDVDAAYIAASKSITLENWMGIVNVIGTTAVNNRLDTISNFPRRHEFKVAPKLSYFTFAALPVPTIVVGDKITGTLTGAKGQIISSYNPPTGAVQYRFVTWSGNFAGETSITAGVHSATIATQSSPETLFFDPSFCDPALNAGGLGNIKLNATSPAILIAGAKGAYLKFNNDDYDAGQNVYQSNGGNFI